jgi:hypothetical protein
MQMLEFLVDGSIVHRGGYGSQRVDDWTSILPGIQKAWLDFIAANRKILREGRRFPIAEPPIVREMFPPGYTFHREGKPGWPPPPPKTAAQLDFEEKQSADFMKDIVLYRFNGWRQGQPKTAAELEKYSTELVLKLDPPLVLLKDDAGGEQTSGLSSAFTWTLYRVTPDGVQELKAPVRLKLRGLASQPNVCKEVFVLQGKLEGGRGVFADITTLGLRFNAGKGEADLAAYKFPEKEYEPTPDSINESLLVPPKPRPATRPATRPG